MKRMIMTLAAAAALLLAGCGTSAPAPPAHSASAACRDFRTWFLAQPQGNIATGKDASVLARGVAEAPSGALYRTLSTLAANVKTTEAAKGTALAQPEEDFTMTGVQSVENYCQSVNPNRG